MDEWEELGAKKSPVKRVAKLGSKKLGGRKLAKPAKEPEPEPEPKTEPLVEPEPEPEPKDQGGDGDGWEDDGDGWPDDDELAAASGAATTAEAEAARQDRLDKLAQPESAEATPEPAAPSPAPVEISDDFADAPDIPDDFDDAPDFDDDF